MAERIVSPGVFTRERDLSFLPQGISDIGAAIIGPTKIGPAFTPTQITSFQEFEEVFGVEDYDWKVLIPGYDIDIHLNFSEIDEGHHGFSELCEWDEEIQDFLDKEPERNRLQNLNHLRHRIISIKNGYIKTFFLKKQSI